MEDGDPKTVAFTPRAHYEFRNWREPGHGCPANRIRDPEHGTVLLRYWPPIVDLMVPDDVEVD